MKFQLVESRFLKSSVVRQKCESQNGCFKKTKHARFSEKRTFLTPWYAYVRVRIRGQEMFVFRKIWRALIFLKQPFWDSPFCHVTDEIWCYLELFVWGFEIAGFDCFKLYIDLGKEGIQRQFPRNILWKSFSQKLNFSKVTELLKPTFVQRYLS